MRVEMEPELAFTALLMIFVLCATYLWWIMYGQPTVVHIQHPPFVDAMATSGESDNTQSHQLYAKAALCALQKHTEAITNISAVQISPQLYSNYLISAETFSMICANLTINKYQMLTVFDDLKSKVVVYSFRFIKFVEILRRYPEYEGLANDLQGTYNDQCTAAGLPIPKAEVPSRDVDKDETNAMPFNNITSSDLELVMLEAKLNTPPEHGYPSEVIKTFTQHFNINQSSVFCMIMGENCVKVLFKVPTLQLPVLEKIINDSEKFLSNIKVSSVKILGKTVFETDSDRKKSKGLPCPMIKFMPELEGIGTNIDSQHHGILHAKISRCTVVLHEGLIYVGGGTCGKSKEEYCKVLAYSPQNPDPHNILSILTKVKFFSLVVFKNELTTVGGMDNKVPTNKIYSWDKMTKEWTECCPPMPTARRSTTSITYGSYLIVIGGALPDTVTLIEVLDIPNQKWYTGPSLPEEMYNVQAVVVGNSLYLLGGCSTSVWYCSLPTLIMGAITALCNLSQLWRKLSSLPFRYSAAALLGKHLLAFGGEEKSNMTDLIHCYSPERNCWEEAGRLRMGRRNCVAMKMMDETVFIIGGADSPAYNNYCEIVEVVRPST